MKTVISDDPTLGQRAFAFRRSILTAKYGRDLPTEPAELAGGVDWILCLDEAGEILGTTRLIHDRLGQGSRFRNRASQRMQLPVPDHESLEVASVLVRPEHRGTLVLAHLWSKLVRFCVESGIRYVCGTPDADFFRMFSLEGEGAQRSIETASARVDLSVRSAPFWSPECGTWRQGLGGWIHPKLQHHRELAA